MRNALTGALAVAAALPLLTFSAVPTIGVSNAPGLYVIGEASIAGTAEIFEGTQLCTSLVPSEVQLRGGADIRFSPHSAGTLFSDRVVLETGSVRVSHLSGYAVQTGELKIDASEPNTQGVVRLTGEMVEVASMGGDLNVTQGGALLTRVARGTRMTFRQSATSNPAQTGAAPARRRMLSDRQAMLWITIAAASAAIVLGSIAATQGKSPF
jgi:hypothetical protein